MKMRICCKDEPTLTQEEREFFNANPNDLLQSYLKKKLNWEMIDETMKLKEEIERLKKGESHRLIEIRKTLDYDVRKGKQLLTNFIKELE